MTNQDVCIRRVQQLKNLRNFIWNQTEGLSCEQLNLIPQKFNNNIIWNLGHLSSVLQKMTYERSGLPIKEDTRYFVPFLSGTKPAQYYDESAIRELKESCFRVFNQLAIDLKSDLFQIYQPSPAISKVYGIDVVNIKDALSYLLYHEGIHAGCIETLKKMI